MKHIIDIVRVYRTQTAIIGKLYFDDNFVCYTLERVGYEIPLGSYPLTLDVVSPKFRYRFPYNSLCRGCVPRLLDVPHRDGILIHIGTFPKDSHGCILVGDMWFKTNPSRLYHSTKAFTTLYKMIKGYKNIEVCVSTLLK